MHKPSAFLLTALLTLSAGNAFGVVYKWEDESGKVQYTQRPPPAGTTYEIIDPRVSSKKASSAKQPEKATAKSDAEPAAEPAPESTDEQIAKRDEVMAKNCEIAKKNLALLESGVRIKTTGADGNEGYLDDSGRESKIAETKGQIAASCK